MEYIPVGLEIHKGVNISFPADVHGFYDTIPICLGRKCVIPSSAPTPFHALEWAVHPVRHPGGPLGVQV